MFLNEPPTTSRTLGFKEFCQIFYDISLSIPNLFLYFMLAHKSYSAQGILNYLLSSICLELTKPRIIFIIIAWRMLLHLRAASRVLIIRERERERELTNGQEKGVNNNDNNILSLLFLFCSFADLYTIVHESFRECW